jgi:hypothetical protein
MHTGATSLDAPQTTGGLTPRSADPTNIRAMPRTSPVSPGLTQLLRRQQGVVTRRQALEHISESAVLERLGRHWQVLLPGVYVAHTGPVTDLQRLWAGLAFSGGRALLDDTTALREYGVHYLPDDEQVRLLVPARVQRTSRDFVSIRRTVYPPPAVEGRGGIRLAPAARALTDFALRYEDERTVRAVLASAVQRRQVSMTLLDEELKIAPARGRRRLVRVLDELHAGVRSAPEGDVRRLVAGSRVLPAPRYNCLLRLPSGRKISPDLLIEEAALVHETNGRRPHFEEEDAFDSMQERHDAMTAAGLTVLHNSPKLIAQDGPRILGELEACYLRDAGRGLPPGVVILRPHAV